MGGDEFAVLLLEADKRAGDRFVRRLCEGLDELIAAGDLPAGLSFSGGAAHYPTEALEASDLLRLADSRQYEVKRSR
jgi:GGDEF domain-containing protein